MATWRPKGRSGVTVSTHGVLFNEGQAEQIVKRWLDDTKDTVAKTGHDLLLARFAKVFKRSRGHYASTIHIVVTEKYQDRLITDGFVIYGTWLEGTATRNRSTKFKGYKSFRRVRLQLRKMLKSVAQDKLDAALMELNR